MRKFGRYIYGREKGAPLGVATLDVTGRIPATQLPTSAMEYKGVWDSSTNTPSLASGAGVNGDYYLVSVAGTTDLDGENLWAVGDALVFNGSLGIWQRAGKSEFALSNGNGTTYLNNSINLGVNTFDGGETLTDSVYIYGANRTFGFGSKTDVINKPLTRFDIATTAGSFSLHGINATGLLHYSGNGFDDKIFGDTTNVNLQFNPDQEITDIYSKYFQGLSLNENQIWLDQTNHSLGYTKYSHDRSGFIFEAITADPYTNSFTINNLGANMLFQDATGIAGYSFSASSIVLLTSQFSGLMAGANGSLSLLAGNGSSFDIDKSGLGDNEFSDGSVSPKGIVYTGDYSATFANESLITKRYVDSLVSSSVQYKGGYDATSTPNASAVTGYMYTVTVAGNGGGFWSLNLEVGDTIISEVDNPITESDWTAIQKNLDAGSIKTSYESNVDTNAFTDAEKTKLAGIEANAQVKPELQKVIYLSDPIATDDICIWKPGIAVTITKVSHQVIGSTSVDFNINHSGGTDLWLSDKTATIADTDETVFTDNTCTANSKVRYQASAISGTPTGIEIVITYTED